MPASDVGAGLSGVQAERARRMAQSHDVLARRIGGTPVCAGEALLGPEVEAFDTEECLWQPPVADWEL
ncbi:hypothetical protein BHS09_31955 [Myxococcus xanthus]|uniref:Uncharacterized protein n=1 Tax=Myxococcus xanthus TaxID=34 RepID=A0AAE6G5Q7_MYXXA|nr:hypothetical protein BHS09_31955 [Myxococcus xanthus]QDE78500.1 hypothetical protein BHS08_31975 [Myxococcus xanthus]